LSKLIKLNRLNIILNGKQINKNGMKFLSNSLSKLINLTDLKIDFRSKIIREEEKSSLSKTLSKYIENTCYYVDLKDCSFSEVGIVFISKSLSNLINLKTFSLYLDDDVDEIFMTSLSVSLTNMINLTSLNIDLSFSPVKDEDFEIRSFPKFLPCLINLNSLKLNLAKGGVNILKESLMIPYQSPYQK